LFFIRVPAQTGYRTLTQNEAPPKNQTEGYYPAGVTSAAALTRGVTRWYVYDGLGSKIAELDDNNNMTSSGQCDVYGAPRAGTQQGVAATSGQGYVGSLGHMTDQSTGGLIYMQARFYDPSLGRFVCEDPGFNGANWYVYAKDNPVNAADCDGKSDVNVTQILGCITTLFVSFLFSPFARGVFLAVAAVLLLPELPLLCGIAAGPTGAAGAVDALVWGIYASFKMAADGLQRSYDSYGPIGVVGEVLGLIMDYGATLELYSDTMDAVDSGD